ncbi:hypothetical protein GCM10009527_009350 [Actinomadura nitritigenes]
MLLGRTLKYLREARQMSQESVAEAMNSAGFSWRQTTAAKTEAGQRPVRVNEVVALAQLFKVSVGDLIEGAGGEWEAHARVLRARSEVERTGRLAFLASREAEDRELEHNDAMAALRAAEADLAKVQQRVVHATTEAEKGAGEE